MAEQPNLVPFVPENQATAVADVLTYNDASDGNLAKKLTLNYFFGKTASATVASGVLTYTAVAPLVVVEVTGQGGSDDEVDVITGPAFPHVLVLKTTAGDAITLNHGVSGGDNIKVAGAATAVVAADDGVAVLVFNGTLYELIANVDNDGA